MESRGRLHRHSNDGGAELVRTARPHPLGRSEPCRCHGAGQMRERVGAAQSVPFYEARARVGNRAWPGRTGTCHQGWCFRGLASWPLSCGCCVVLRLRGWLSGSECSLLRWLRCRLRRRRLTLPSRLDRASADGTLWRRQRIARFALSCSFRTPSATRLRWR